MNDLNNLHADVRSSPGACVLLVHRARLSAEKRGLPIDKVLGEFLAENKKLRSALTSADGLRLREVAELVHDERSDFYNARMRDAENYAEKNVAVDRLCADVTAIAETTIPGIYFDAVAS